MSGRKNKTGKTGKGPVGSYNYLQDVTLNDFANSKVARRTGRIKKSATRSQYSLVREVNQLTMEEAGDRAWDDRLVVRESKIVVTRPTCRFKKTVSEDAVNSRPGIVYPLDIWYLISEHVEPESVGTFSLLCKSALIATKTKKFWLNLYKRHYKSVPNLPERLHPQCMTRLCGLRACVVRTLFFTYPPFVERIKPVTTFEGDPHNLTKRQCILMWHKQFKSKWIFSFKLKSIPWPTPEQSNLFEMLKEVLANQEEGCKVLEVTCLNFISLPIVLGMTLCTVSLNLSQGLLYYRLQLGFGAGHICHTAGKPTADYSGMLVLDSVANVRVLDWWHPMYPHATNGV